MDEDVKYDEDNAIEFIRKTLPEDVSAEYEDDDILYIIDIIWDWYEKNGYLDLNSDVTQEEEHDVSKLTDYVVAQLKKDKEANMDMTHVGLIVRGEIEYEESIEDVF